MAKPLRYLANIVGADTKLKPKRQKREHIRCKTPAKARTPSPDPWSIYGHYGRFGPNIHISL
jgi:hypothetical protein